VSAVLGHSNLETTSIYVHGRVQDLHAGFPELEKSATTSTTTTTAPPAGEITTTPTSGTVN